MPCETAGPAPCSGHDYRQVLEVAAAIKLSAREGHRRVALPLTDRSVTVMPMPYRWHGGDVTGWEVINRGEPTPSSSPSRLSPTSAYPRACEKQTDAIRGYETMARSNVTIVSPADEANAAKYASVHAFGE